MTNTCPHLSSDGIGVYRCVTCGTVIDPNGEDAFLLPQYVLVQLLANAFQDARGSWLDSDGAEQAREYAKRIAERVRGEQRYA